MKLSADGRSLAGPLERYRAPFPEDTGTGLRDLFQRAFPGPGFGD